MPLLDERRKLYLRLRVVHQKAINPLLSLSQAKQSGLSSWLKNSTPFERFNPQHHAIGFHTSCFATSGIYSIMARRTRQDGSAARSWMAGSSDCDNWLIPITASPSRANDSCWNYEPRLISSRCEMIFKRTSENYQSFKRKFAEAHISNWIFEQFQKRRQEECDGSTNLLRAAYESIQVHTLLCQ